MYFRKLAGYAVLNAVVYLITLLGEKPEEHLCFGTCKHSLIYPTLPPPQIFFFPECFTSFAQQLQFYLTRILDWVKTLAF